MAWSMTTSLIVLVVVVFIVQNVVQEVRPDIISKYFALSIPGLKHGYVWELVTFQFLHAPIAEGGILHLLGNLFTIYVIGRPVEEAVGKSNWLKLYLSSGIVGGMVQMLAGLLWSSRFGGGGVVGASAGAFGLVAAFATLFPHRPLSVFFLPFEFRARTLLWLSIGFSVFGMLFLTSSQVAYCAHLGGILTGWFYIRWLTQIHTPLDPWRFFRRQTARRELVNVRSQKPQLWRRPKAPNAEEIPPGEFISREVDPILDKISAHGIQSLTQRERQILEAARAKMSKR
jgi:membrane associated rhomboid family serine protease